MTARSVYCLDCGSAVAYGHLSCSTCGALLASVAGVGRTALVGGGLEAVQPSMASPVIKARGDAGARTRRRRGAEARADALQAAEPVSGGTVRRRPTTGVRGPAGDEATAAIRADVRPVVLEAAGTEAAAIAAVPEERQASGSLGPLPGGSMPQIPGRPVSTVTEAWAGAQLARPGPWARWRPGQGNAFPNAFPEDPVGDPGLGFTPASVAATGTTPAGGSPRGGSPTVHSLELSLGAATGRALRLPVRPSGPHAGAAQPDSGPDAAIDDAHAGQARAMADRGAELLAVAGATVAIFGFLLPFATDGVIGTDGVGYLSTWGLANPAYLLLVALCGGLLALNLLPNGVPVRVRSGLGPVIVGCVLAGLAFAYFARPYGGGTGVTVMAVGALALVVGGLLAVVPVPATVGKIVDRRRHDPATPAV